MNDHGKQGVVVRSGSICDSPSVRLFVLTLWLAVPAAAQDRRTPVEEPGTLLAGHEARLRLVLKEAYGPDVALRAIVRPSFQAEYAVGLRRGAAGFEIFALQPSRQVWTYEAIRLMKSGRMGSMTVEGLLDDSPRAPEESKAGSAKAAAEAPRSKRRQRIPDRSGPADAIEDLADALEEAPAGPDFRDTTGEEIARMAEGLPENPADLPVARCAVAVDDALAARLVVAWRGMLEGVGPDPWGAGLDGTSYSFAMTVDGRTLEGETWSPRPKTRPARLAELAATLRDYCVTPDPARFARIGKLARRLGGR